MRSLADDSVLKASFCKGSFSTFCRPQRQRKEAMGTERRRNCSFPASVSTRSGEVEKEICEKVIGEEEDDDIGEVRPKQQQPYLIFVRRVPVLEMKRRNDGREEPQISCSS